MQQTISDFVNYVGKKLGIQELPKFHIVDDPKFSKDHKTFGMYFPDKKGFIVEVYNRNIVDVLRTIAHEMRHHKQNEDGSTKSHVELENEATMAAGMIVKLYCENHPELYSQEFDKGK